MNDEIRMQINISLQFVELFLLLPISGSELSAKRLEIFINDES